MLAACKHCSKPYQRLHLCKHCEPQSRTNISFTERKKKSVAREQRNVPEIHKKHETLLSLFDLAKSKKWPYKSTLATSRLETPTCCPARWYSKKGVRATKSSKLKLETVPKPYLLHNKNARWGGVEQHEILSSANNNEKTHNTMATQRRAGGTGGTGGGRYRRSTNSNHPPFSEAEVSVKLGPEFQVFMPKIGDSPTGDRAIRIKTSEIERSLNRPRTRQHATNLLAPPKNVEKNDNRPL